MKLILWVNSNGNNIAIAMTMYTTVPICISSIAVMIINASTIGSLKL
jgi:hypothetical protein